MSMTARRLPEVGAWRSKLAQAVLGQRRVDLDLVVVVRGGWQGARPTGWPTGRGAGCARDRPSGGSSRAEHAWLQGDLDRTAAEATKAFELAVRIGHPWYVGELAYWLWRASALPEVPVIAAEEDVRIAVELRWRPVG